MAIIEAIQTDYLEADAGNITWSAIPQTYKHLQIRISTQDHNATNSGTGFTLAIYFNGDNNYGKQVTGLIRGHGTTEVVYRSTGWSTIAYMQAEVDIPRYSGSVMDIMDYTSTNKKSVCTSLSGYVGTLNNVEFGSSMWHTATSGSGVDAAVTSIMLHSPGGGGLLRGTSATLYGIKSS